MTDHPVTRDELRERLTAILWDEDHRVPSRGESAWGRCQRLIDALLNEDSPLREILTGNE